MSHPFSQVLLNGKTIIGEVLSNALILQKTSVGFRLFSKQDFFMKEGFSI